MLASKVFILESESAFSSGLPGSTTGSGRGSSSGSPGAGEPTNVSYVPIMWPETNSTALELELKNILIDLQANAVSQGIEAVRNHIQQIDDRSGRSWLKRVPFSAAERAAVDYLDASQSSPDRHWDCSHLLPDYLAGRCPRPFEDDETFTYTDVMRMFSCLKFLAATGADISKP